MIKLIIDDPGLTLLINGKEFRTPAEVSISLSKVHEVVKYLKANGIHKYKFISEPEVIKKRPEVRGTPTKTSISGVIIENDIVQKENKISSKEYKILSEKLENIEQILNNFSNKETVVREVIYEESNKTKKKKNVELYEEFIPSVDTSGLQMKTSGSKTLRSTGIDLDAANSLSKLSKKGNN